MRTDSVRISDDALTAVREYIGKRYGAEILPEKPNYYKVKKAAQAQDAHEAVRPTSMDLDPEKIKDYLTKEEYNLYKLIWERFVASQMKPALFDVTDADIECANLTLRASGEVLKFPGFLAIFQDTTGEDDEADEKRDAKALPPLNEGDVLKLNDLETKQNFTQPPPRFTEATLVKALEENGIGRPSTYGAILTTIQTRDYTHKEDGKFFPTHLGVTIAGLLKTSFADIIDEKYTARLEEELDEIEEGKLEWTTSMRSFADKFNRDLDKARIEMKQVKGAGLETDEKCENCASPMVIKFGRYGEFMACTNYPECKTTKEIARGDAAAATGPDDEQIICDKCNKPMQLKRSRFGQFFACTGYPDCKNTKDPRLLKANIPTDPQPPCENCGKEMVLKSGRYGPFYSCAGYPDCKTIRKLNGRKSTPPKPTGVKCPNCKEGEMVERMSRRGVFYSCSRYPKCEFSLNKRPIAKSCPECNAPYLLEKETKREGHQEVCNNPECGYKAPFSGETPTAANE
jgi:DNA topoisomerase-1